MTFSIHDVLGKVIRIQHPQTQQMVMGIGWIVVGYADRNLIDVTLKSLPHLYSETLSYNTLRYRMLTGVYVVDVETTVSLAMEAA